MSFALGVVTGFLGCFAAFCLLRAAFLAGRNSKKEETK